MRSEPGSLPRQAPRNLALIRSPVTLKLGVLFGLRSVMRMSDFASEFGPSTFSLLSGAPMPNGALAAAADSMDPGERAEASLTNLLREAVYPFYFAKHTLPRLTEIAQLSDEPIAPAAELIRTALMKQAVIGIASTFDLATTTPTGRTLSLPHAIDALDRELKKRIELKPDQNSVAALDLMAHIRSSTNADVVPALKYARHLRNKWAGHNSLDRTFDSWADTDRTVHLGLLEDAVSRMVNAYQDLGTLSAMNDDLKEIETAKDHSTADQNGSVIFEMGLAWAGANPLAQAIRDVAKKHASAFIAALTGSSGPQ